MITNGSLTVYHQNGLDVSTRLETWRRYNYPKIWWFGGKGAGINKGYDNANDVAVRIPYADNNGLDINNFSIGDILVYGNLDIDINRQQDLKGYQIYNITSINNDNFGGSPHIHLGGK